MENLTHWYVIIGSLLITMAIMTSFVTALPISTSAIYLLLGVVLGPYGFELLKLDVVRQFEWLELATEFVVIISLFAAGLKLRLPLNAPLWRSAARLAFGSMLLTVGLIALFAFYVLNLPLGAAVLLGAILAPTDPVLASAVQVRGPGDEDQLRFSLTGEAALNDGAAFPFVMLGLGLLGLHDLGDFGVRWILVDLIWATVAGLAIGTLAGTAAVHLTLFLRRRKKDTVILEDFLALGLIFFSYGAALAVYAYGFLAVFAAGLAIRRVERFHNGESYAPVASEVLVKAEREPHNLEPEEANHMFAKNALNFDEQLERLGEVVTVLIVGAIVSFRSFLSLDAWLIPFLLLFVRPASVFIGLFRDRATQIRRHYISWFGIRGIGSLYYLMYAIRHGLPTDLAERLTSITFATVAVSILVHGITSTPIMMKYEEKMGARA